MIHIGSLFDPYRDPQDPYRIPTGIFTGSSQGSKPYGDPYRTFRGIHTGIHIGSTQAPLWILMGSLQDPPLTYIISLDTSGMPFHCVPVAYRAYGPIWKAIWLRPCRVSWLRTHLKNLTAAPVSHILAVDPDRDPHRIHTRTHLRIYIGSGSIKLIC